ncbi:MAG TPA: hypothetical protein VG672_26005 [Bryobacteraceae bacterium]|nr:hypothetical protein [Bryobacteraceae bacterium]
MRAVGLVFLWLATANAAVTINAVTDAATYGPRVAPGSLATIFGDGLANSTAEATGFPLPTNLGGAIVRVNDTPVPLTYASPTQINFQVPRTLAAGTASLYVALGSNQSSRVSFTVVAAAPSVFQDNQGHAIAQNAGAGYSLNTTGNPAEAGSVVVVYLTGQGPVDNSVADGTAAPESPLSTVTSEATATIGGTDATIQFLGLTPGFAGLAQVNVEVPDLPSGDYPLVLTVGGYLGASAVVSVHSSSNTGTAPPAVLSLAGQASFYNPGVTMPAVYGNYTYICGPNRIHIVNTATASAPSYVGSFGSADLSGNGGRCALSDPPRGVRTILVDIVGPGNNPSFIAYDVNSPTDPVLAGQVQLLPYSYLADLSFIGVTGFSSTSWYEFDGNQNITAQHGDVLAYDFSNPGLPYLLSALAPVSSQPASSNTRMKPNALRVLHSSGYPDTVYVASTTAAGTNTNGSAALDVIDVSTPSAIKAVRQVTVSDAAIFLGFAYQSRLLVLAGNSEGYRNPGVPDFNMTGNLTVTTMNITTVQNPVVYTTVETELPSTGAYTVQPLGGSFFAIVSDPPASDPDGPGTIVMVDARDPQKPVVYPFATIWGLGGMQTTGSSLLTPTLNGLNVYKITLPTS